MHPTLIYWEIVFNTKADPRCWCQVNMCMRSLCWHEQALGGELGHFKETMLQATASGAAPPQKDWEPREDCARCCSNGEANAWARRAPWRQTGLILHTVNAPLRGFKWSAGLREAQHLTPWQSAAAGTRRDFRNLRWRCLLRDFPPNAIARSCRCAQGVGAPLTGWELQGVFTSSLGVGIPVKHGTGFQGEIFPDWPCL